MLLQLEEMLPRLYLPSMADGRPGQSMPLVSFWKGLFGVSSSFFSFTLRKNAPIIIFTRSFLSFGVFKVYYSSHEPFASQGQSVATIGTTAIGVSYFMSPIFSLVLQYRFRSDCDSGSHVCFREYRALLACDGFPGLVVCRAQRVGFWVYVGWNWCGRHSDTFLSGVDVA